MKNDRVMQFVKNYPKYRSKSAFTLKRTMIRRNRPKHKLILVSFILGIAVLYNEFFVYEIQRFKWTMKDCTDCVKVLLVADPQILGERNENYFGSWFARWDSDRYLSKTFSRALSHSKPDAIAFLGDLMDEGLIATTEQFIRYKNRFDAIFHTPENIMKIYVPGDNDIGGEDERVSPHMNERFQFTFSQPDTLICKNLIFFKVNRLTKNMPSAPKDAFLNDYTERNITNVILSHIPLLFNPGQFVKNVLKELSPQIIFTAHEHKGMHLSLDTTIDQLSNIWIIPPHETSLRQFRFDMGDIHEIQIPTCSYRMGTTNMGYGLAYIDTADKSLDFTMLWLPERFPKLRGYLWIISIVMIIAMCNCICTCCPSSHYVTYNHLPSV